MDGAHKATDKALARLERRLAEIYAKAGTETGRKWKAYLAKIDEEIAGKKSAYAAAKRSGDKKEIRKAGIALAQAKREKTVMNAHYQALTQQLAEQLTHINQQAARLIDGKLPDIYALNYNAVAADVKSAMAGYSFELTSPDVVRRLMMEDDTLLPTVKIDAGRDTRWNAQQINSQVLQGILKGDPIPEIADRLKNVLNMNEVAAVRNARTAITSAENRGRMDMMHRAKEVGVNVMKVWIATNDERTREAHAKLDGQEAEIDRPFSSILGDIMFPGDPDARPANVWNCRCSFGYHVKGFAR